MRKPTGRRVFDVCVAALVLASTSPIFALLAVVGILASGRAFFSQIRLGRDLRPFVLLKFQTMVNRASPGSTVTAAGDARITPYGRVLRTLKLDELPQLINILRGEMSLVGPRPLTPNEIDAMPRHLAAVVYRAVPGLTGISSIAFVDEERLLAASSEPERAYFEDVLPRKIALELAYAQRRTWLTDLILLLLTPLAPFVPVVRRRILVRLVPEWQGLTVGARVGSKIAVV
jgi:lipopolysaccharide/colanic/teichoic acid biosynthesis glycosyltransferase